MLEVTRRTLKRVAVIAVVVIPFSLAFAAPITLGSYNVKIDETSVSGISSGADMAVQFAVAHSSLVRGVGAIAGSPYYCAQGRRNDATGSCMIGPPPRMSDLKAAIAGFEKDKLIDATSNMAAQKVWLFSGYNDGVVKTRVVDALLTFYQSYTDSGNIYFKEDLPAAHAMLTTWSNAHSCDYTGGDFMNNCKGKGLDPAGYDAAGLILQHFYGKLNSPNRGPLSSEPIEFQQSEFLPEGTSLDNMAQRGYVYVPASCAHQDPCRVHIAFHGCGQSATKIGDDFYKHAGYNAWADTNHIIVLYPQAEASSPFLGPFGSNPLGCWDWWGYTDGHYAEKGGRQIVAVTRMLERLAQKYIGWKSAPAGASGSPLSLSALDSSPSRVALAWTPVAGVDGYNIYRLKVSGDKCPKPPLPETTRINSKILQGNSYSDSGLSNDTHYCYQVKAVPSNAASEESKVVQGQTTHKATDCDPYVRPVSLHVQENRAYIPWYGAAPFARAIGSDQYVGYRYSTDWVLLTETKKDYFVVNQPCKPGD